MTDEELAESIEPRFFDCSDYCSEFDSGCAFKCKHNRGEDFLLEWLQSEAEQQKGAICGHGKNHTVTTA